MPQVAGLGRQLQLIEFDFAFFSKDGLQLEFAAWIAQIHILLLCERLLCRHRKGEGGVSRRQRRKSALSMGGACCLAWHAQWSRLLRKPLISMAEACCLPHAHAVPDPSLSA